MVPVPDSSLSSKADRREVTNSSPGQRKNRNTCCALSEGLDGPQGQGTKSFLPARGDSQRSACACGTPAGKQPGRRLGGAAGKSRGMCRLTVDGPHLSGPQESSQGLSSSSRREPREFFKEGSEVMGPVPEEVVQGKGVKGELEQGKAEGRAG